MYNLRKADNNGGKNNATTTPAVTVAMQHDEGVTTTAKSVIAALSGHGVMVTRGGDSDHWH